MRVAFVDECVRLSIPLGITGVASMLREGGHEVGLFVFGNEPQETIERIRAFRPDAVAFSVLSGSHQTFFTFAQQLKSRLDVATVFGGPHLTFFPEAVEFPWVDAVCRGEGEEAFLLFADRFDELGGKLPTDVPNFWVRANGTVHRNPVMPRNRHLDDLPYPARDLYYEQFPILRDHGVKHFIAHRGCPYKCTYCFNDAFNRMYREDAGDKKVFQSRSPENICDEILWLRERVPIEMVAFVDDVFTLHRRWTLEFCEVYARRVRLPFSMNARFDNVDPGMVEALADAGLCLVYAGVESGDETIRNKVMLRKMTEESILEAAALYKKHGVKILTENILGVPGETLSSALETLRVNQAVRPDVANASVFTPYPKLPMTEYAIEHGYFDGDFDKLNSNYYHDSVIRFDSEQERNQILNLRCFFSILARHPHLMRVIGPFLKWKPNGLFRWLGDLLDGYYLKKCLPYRFTPRRFLATFMHWAKWYRGKTSAGRNAAYRVESSPSIHGQGRVTGATDRES
jgi:radical SAM superfamily enzyme YgiQ (UPF0313 family)